MNAAEPARPGKGTPGHEASPDHDTDGPSHNGAPDRAGSDTPANGVPTADQAANGAPTADPAANGAPAAELAPPVAEPEPTAGGVEPPATEAAPDGGQPDGAQPDAGQPEKKRRAGRDLRAAIAVGLGMGALVLVSLLTVRQIFIGVVAAAVAVATIELAGALRRSKAGIEVALIPVLVGGQAMVWLSWQWRQEGILGAFVVTILACFVWRFRGGSDGYVQDVTASIFTAAYVPMFASFAAMLVEPRDGTARVLCFLIVVVCSDTGGYVAGVLFGKHPMAPSISPKKSWEGFSGSMLAGVIGGALSVMLLLHGHWWQGLPFGAALVICATFGDLVESLIKRDLGIKDMGSLLPGHGGLMDRLDSLLPSAVASWLLLTALVPV